MEAKLAEKLEELGITFKDRNGVEIDAKAMAKKMRAPEGDALYIGNAKLKSHIDEVRGIVFIPSSLRFDELERRRSFFFG